MTIIMLALTASHSHGAETHLSGTGRHRAGILGQDGDFNPREDNFETSMYKKRCVYEKLVPI